jgi:hypothetical protein
VAPDSRKGSILITGSNASARDAHFGSSHSIYSANVCAGKLRPLALTGGLRLPRLPGVPMNFREVSRIHSHRMVCRRSAPDDAQRDLAGNCASAAISPDIKDRPQQQMLVAGGGSRCRARLFIHSATRSGLSNKWAWVGIDLESWRARYFR